MKTQGNTPTSKKHDAQSARREVARFRRSLAENPSICASLALYWFWQITLFQSPAATLWTALFDAPQLSYPTLLAALAISYAALWALHRGASKVARCAWYLPVISMFMLCGTAIAIIPLRQSALSLPHAPIAASCLIGVGSAAFVVEMGRFFAKTGTRSALSAGIVSAICGTMLFSLCGMLPTAVSDVLLTVSPAIACALLSTARKGFRKDRYYSHGLNSKPKFPPRYAATCLVQGLAFGFMAGTISSVSHQGPIALPVLYSVAFLAGAALLALTALPLGLDFNHLLYKVGHPLMAIGFLLLCCTLGNTTVCGFIFTAGYCYVYIIMTCLNAHFSHDLGCSPGWIVALSTFFLVLGQIAAQVLVGTIAWFASASVLTTEIAGIMAFALPACSLVFLDERNSSSGWGAMRPGQDDVDERAGIARKLSSEFALTPREVDVALILARGRNKERAAEELHLARETVKTHTANIYRKLAIHSQQELIDLVEGLR